MSHAHAASPSAWAKRLPIMSVATVGLVVATALATFQVHLSADVWDPFFGGASSARVVTAPFLSWLPIPDALLGMGGYLADIFSDAIGDEDRWRTMPWMTLLFGVVITGMALVSVGLVIVQAFLVHAWCSLCLASALISWTVFALGIHEPLAAVGFVRDARRRGVPLSHALRGQATVTGHHSLA